MDSLRVAERRRELSNNQLRREGFVPGVIYGPRLESTQVEIAKRELARALREKRESFTAEAGGKSLEVRFQEVQKDSVSGEAVHFSLLHL